MHNTNTGAWRVSNIKFTSYLMNGCVISSATSFNWDAGARGSTYRISSFRPTDMLFWETDESDPNNYNDGASTPAEGFSKRHITGAVIGLMGGHVRYIKWAQYYALLADPRRNELWCFPGSANGR